jgi:hypothetical protein
MRFVSVACYTYNKIGWQNRVKYVSHPTEPANYTDSYTTVLAEEFPNSERRLAAAVGIAGFIICLLGYFDLEDMEIIIY